MSQVTIVTMQQSIVVPIHIEQYGKRHSHYPSVRVKMAFRDHSSIFYMLSVLVTFNLVQLNHCLLDDLSTIPLQINDWTMGEKEFKGSQTVPKPRYRLPANLVPLSYNIYLRPILDDVIPNSTVYTTHGNVTILVTCVHVAKVITLHQRNLTIDQRNVKVTAVSSKSPLTIIDHDFNYDKDFYNIYLRDDLEIGERYQIFVPFIGGISVTENVGLFLAKNTDLKLNVKLGMTLVVTKLEPYHARKVFPLFDEPNLKATFALTIGRQARFTSLANMPLRLTIPDDQNPGWVWDRFQDTEPMSSYIFCFVVTDFVNVAADIKTNHTLSLWAPPQYANSNVHYTLNLVDNLLTFFETKFRVPYTLPKLDLVAVPDFTIPAMENWGLATIHPEYLMYFPGESTERERQRMIEILAHEMSHQWFGNLVTCAWWSDIWLNEGFGKFFSYWGVKAFAPEFDPELTFVSRVTQIAMLHDLGSSAHPVKNEAMLPDEQSAVFDRITYEKGAALLQMMEAFLTPSVFLDGLHHFLTSMKFKGAEQTDLFTAFTHAGAGAKIPSDVTLHEIMDTWTLQPGFPLVKVKKINSNEISLSQTHIDNKNNGTSLWWIPLKIITSTNPSVRDLHPTIWLPNSRKRINQTVTLDLTADEWIIVNADSIGYFKVLYDTPLTQLIKQQLMTNPNVFPAKTRSQIIDDYFTMALLDYVSIETALEFTLYLDKESEFCVWESVFINLNDAYTRFSGTLAFQALKSYLLPRIEGTLKVIGNEQLTHETGSKVNFRARLLDFACGMKQEACVQYSKRLVNQWLSSTHPNSHKIFPDLQPIAYCTVIRSGNLSVWSRVWEENDKSLKWARKLLLGAVACAEDSGTLLQTLEKGLKSKSLSDPERYTVVDRVAAHSKGQIIAFEFLKRNLESVGARMFARVVSTLSHYWSTQNHINQLQSFMTQHAQFLHSEMASLHNSITNIELNIMWWNHFGFKMQAWLQENSYPIQT